MRRWLDDIAVGAAAGAVATLPMTAVMWAAERAGWMRRQPPEEITGAALDAVGADPSEQQRDKATAASHLLFGASSGALFGGVHRLLPATGALVPTGIAFALLVWVTAYQGWVPALRIMPPADEDEQGRPESMVAAHVVYGAVLGLVVAGARRAH